MDERAACSSPDVPDGGGGHAAAGCTAAGREGGGGGGGGGFGGIGAAAAAAGRLAPAPTCPTAAVGSVEPGAVAARLPGCIFGCETTQPAAASSFSRPFGVASSNAGHGSASLPPPTRPRHMVLRRSSPIDSNALHRIQILRHPRRR